MQLNAFASVVLYLTVFVTAMVFAYLGEKTKKKTFCILAVLLPVLLAGFRYTTGTDSQAYRVLYNEIGSESFPITLGRVLGGGIEPFVVGVSFIGNALQMPPCFLFIAFAAITAGFLYLTTKIISVKHAWLVYGALLFMVFPESFNAMRQVAAVSVQAFALAFIFNEHQNGRRARIVPMLLLLAFSVTLHYSSLLLLPVFVLPTIVKHVRGYTLAMLLCVLIAGCVLAFPKLLDIVVSLHIMSERHYTAFMEMPGSLINIKFFAAAVAAVVLIANYFRRNKQIDKQYSLLMLLGVAYAAIGFYSGYFGRLALFFWIFVIMFAIKLICQLFEKENHRVAVCSVAVILYFVVYFCVFGLNAIMPYSLGA